MNRELIKAQRICKFMSQTELAVKVGVSLTSIQLWERGASTPTLENKEKLYKVLGLIDKDK